MWCFSSLEFLPPPHTIAASIVAGTCWCLSFLMPWWGVWVTQGMWLASLLSQGILHWGMSWSLYALGRLADLLPPPMLTPVATPPASAQDAQTIAQFFQNLYDNGIKIIVYAAALFFFGWGAIGLMFPGERSQDHARASLYRALGGLALALLATAISSLIAHAIP